jgi:uncharacterized protein (UPF0218 family)
MQSKSVNGIIMGYKLPSNLRGSLRDPIGQVFTGKQTDSAKKAIDFIYTLGSHFTVAIGDVCSRSLLEQEFFPNIIVFDKTTRRSNKISLNLSTYQMRSAINPKEWILEEAWAVIKQSIAFSTSNNCRIAVRIDGEEDLLIIPAIISLPIGSVVVYGQPPIATEEGIVVVPITSSLKDRVTNLLEKFEYHEELSNGNHNN